MTVLVGNHDFLTGCKLNGDSVLNAEFCLEYVEISTNGVKIFLDDKETSFMTHQHDGLHRFHPRLILKGTGLS